MPHHHLVWRLRGGWCASLNSLSNWIKWDRAVIRGLYKDITSKDVGKWNIEIILNYKIWKFNKTKYFYIDKSLRQIIRYMGHDCVRVVYANLYRSPGFNSKYVFYRKETKTTSIQCRSDSERHYKDIVTQSLNQQLLTVFSYIEK